MASKEREVLVTAIVAGALNEATGADYEAVPSKTDPPDTLLVSRSGEHPTRQVEVVSIACDPAIRTDNHNRARFERILRETLIGLGLNGYRISAHWSDTAVQRGTKKELIAALAEVIVRLAPPTGSMCIDGCKLYGLSPQLSEVVNFVSIFRLPYERLEVHGSQSWWAPRDGIWIETAVNKKLAHYGGNCSGLTLIVDGLSHLDAEQIEAFRGVYRTSSTSFDSLWVVSMGRAHRIWVKSVGEIRDRNR
jgi:hypothetical protein